MALFPYGMWASGTAFSGGDLFRAPWIAASTASGSTAMKLDFEVSGMVRSADLYVAAVGNYRLYVNGSDIALSLSSSPNPSKTVYADVYNIKNSLRDGANTVGLLLDGGLARREPIVSACLVVEYRDGRSDTLTTGQQWVSMSAVATSVADSCYVYDVRNEISDWKSGKWMNCRIAEAPGGVVRQNPVQYYGDVTDDTNKMYIPAVDVRRDGNDWIVDFGEIVDGTVWLPVNGVSAGDSVIVSYSVNKGYEKGDIYVAGGSEKGYMFLPPFSRHLFWQVRISGLPSLAKEEVIARRHQSASLLPTGNFSCSSSYINSLYEKLANSLRSFYYIDPAKSMKYAVGFSYVYDIEKVCVKILRDYVESGDSMPPSSELLSSVLKWQYGNTELEDYTGTADSINLVENDWLSWMFVKLGGIRPLEPAYERVCLSPDFFSENMSWVKCSLDTKYGLIVSNWRKDEEGHVEWEIQTPEGVKAEIPSSILNNRNITVKHNR